MGQHRTSNKKWLLPKIPCARLSGTPDSVTTQSCKGRLNINAPDPFTENQMISSQNRENTPPGNTGEGSFQHILQVTIVDRRYK